MPQYKVLYFFFDSDHDSEFSDTFQIINSLASSKLALNREIFVFCQNSELLGIILQNVNQA